jgi:hypothetical protein
MSADTDDVDEKPWNACGRLKEMATSIDHGIESE